ncbi:MAG TPA: DUF883 family protein [Burkholderiales bacterium]|nr:DUF883 family protein [Burkholderiales bacterium]
MYTGNVIEAKNKLTADLNTVIEDTELLLQATANQANEKVVAARARVQETIKAVKQKIDATQEVAVERAKATAVATDEYVHAHPWPMIGFAAAAGALVGLLITRR